MSRSQVRRIRHQHAEANEWLNTLSPQQVRALAQQHGISVWADGDIEYLRTELILRPAIHQEAKDYDGREESHAGL
jgi:hypothetical protein